MKKKFFKAAKEESYLSDYDKQHIGAVAIYKDKVILARAHNSKKTNTTQYYYNKYRATNSSNILSTPARAHAETNLYRKIRYLDIDFADVSVYIYRQFKNGTPAMARCCNSCERLLRDLGIKKICYSVNNGYVEEKFYKE